MRKGILKTLALGLSLFLVACGDSGKEEKDVAASYPEKSIKLIVPWGAGGDTDAIYRLVAKELSKELEQNVVIQNIGGGSGVVGSQQALTAPNDGYTMLAIHDSLNMTDLLGQSDFGVFDFEPIALVSSTYTALATHPDSPWENMQDLIEDAKKEPGKISFAASIGSTSQLEPALIQTAGDIEFNIVGFDGTAERMKAIVGQDVKLGMVTITAGKEYLEADRLKLLGISAPDRVSALPELKTMKEQGLDVVSATNRGLVFPKDTPNEIIEKMADALDKAINNEEFQKKLEDLGTDLNFKPKEDYVQFLETRQEEVKEAMIESNMMDAD